MNSKGLAQLAYEKGMYVLTAAQSFQAAQEVSKLGHGLLTYVLVDEGLKRAVADSDPVDDRIDIREWLDYATRRVPQVQLHEMEVGSGASARGTAGLRRRRIATRCREEDRPAAAGILSPRAERHTARDGAHDDPRGGADRAAYGRRKEW
jgi:hypothetical protein